MPGARRSVLANAAQLVSARAVTYGLRAVYVALLARLLGADLFGLLASTQAWYLAVLPLTTLGMTGLLARELPRAPAETGSILSSTLGAGAVAAIAGGLACAAAGLLLEPDPTARALLVLFGLALTGRALNAWGEGAFIALEDTGRVLRLEALFRPLEVAAGLTALALGAGVLAIAAVHASAYWLQALSAVALVRRGRVEVHAAFDWPRVRPLLLAGLPLLAYTVLSSWLLQGPLVAYRHVSTDASSVGHFALLLQALLVLATLPVAGGSAALPALSRAAARGDGSDLRQLGAMLRLAIVAGVAAGLAGQALGPWAVPRIFGEPFAAAGDLLGLALLVLTPIGAATVAAQGLISAGWLRSTAVGPAAGLALEAALFVPLGAAYGARGALLAVALGMTLRAVVLLALLRAARPFPLADAVTVPVLGAALGLWLYHLLSASSPVLALAVGVVALVATAYLPARKGRRAHERRDDREVLRTSVTGPEK